LPFVQTGVGRAGFWKREYVRCRHASIELRSRVLTNSSSGCKMNRSGQHRAGQWPNRSQPISDKIRRT
jgi:hypothetical protein